MIVAETEMWRKVRDISGDEAWVRKREIARTDPKALLNLKQCRNGWCEVKSESSGLKGWARQDMLWGAKRP